MCSCAQVHVALSVVSFATPYGRKLGVASTWLDRLCGGIVVGEKSTDQAQVRHALQQHSV